MTNSSRSRLDRPGLGQSTIAHDLVKIAIHGLCAAACSGVQAQDEPPASARRAFFVEPYVSIRETYTDNNRLAANNNASEFITQASAGVNMRANSARLRGHLSYTLTGLVYARDTADNELQHALNAFATGEAVENLAYVDVGASVSQQLISAFGTQSPDSAVGNSNRAEVSTYSLSPYLRGTAAAFADYEARLSYKSTKSDQSALSDVATSGALLRLMRESALGPLGWSLELSRQVIDYSAGRENEEDRIQGEATWAVRYDLALTAIAGRESNNFVSAEKQANNVWGGRVSWRPTPRTNVLVERQHRFFGDAHVVDLSHRTPRTVWTFLDTRHVQTSQGQPVLGSLGTAFDLLFRHFESIEPDPVARQFLVISYLRANNINPAAEVIAPFLTSRVTLERLQQLSFAWRGLRDTLVLTASRSDSRRLDTVTSVLDDFTNSDRIDQRGLVANVTHRLSPISSLGVIGAYREVLGSADALATKLRSLTVQWSSSLTSQSDVSAGARHAVFDSATSSYDETAVFVTLLWRF
jgi:uncharacterized protein (PEP-CTERM system associated)